MGTGSAYPTNRNDRLRSCSLVNAGDRSVDSPWCGIPWSDKGDMLGNAANQLLPSLSCFPDSRRSYHDVKLAVRDDKWPSTLSPRASRCVFKGFSKHCFARPGMRKFWARTDALLFKTWVDSSSLWSTCQMTKTIEHLLDDCSNHFVPRGTLLRNLISISVSVQLRPGTIRLTRNVHYRRVVQRVLIVFKQETGIARRFCISRPFAFFSYFFFLTLFLS